MPDIIEIVFEFLDRILIAFSVRIIHLRPAGDARLHQVPKMIERNCFLVALSASDPFRTRTDQAHFATKYVEELRQLIETQLSDPTPRARHAGIVLPGVSVARFFTRMHHHRAKFISDERLAPAADPLLPEYNRPPDHWQGQIAGL